MSKRSKELAARTVRDLKDRKRLKEALARDCYYESLMRGCDRSRKYHNGGYGK